VGWGWFAELGKGRGEEKAKGEKRKDIKKEDSEQGPARKGFLQEKLGDDAQQGHSTHHKNRESTLAIGTIGGSAPRMLQTQPRKEMLPTEPSTYFLSRNCEGRGGNRRGMLASAKKI